MTDAWQIAAVALIEALAVGYLVSRFWSRRPKAPAKPDVEVSRLVRKKR